MGYARTGRCNFTSYGGASLWVAFTAVALANMRMLLMTISGMEMLGLRDRDMGF